MGELRRKGVGGEEERARRGALTGLWTFFFFSFRCTELRGEIVSVRLCPLLCTVLCHA